MFETAKQQIKNWEVISTVNKSMSKGKAWNILAKDFDINTEYHVLAITNMIWEFGDFLPIEILYEEPKKRKQIVVYHEEPIFN